MKLPKAVWDSVQLEIDRLETLVSDLKAAWEELDADTPAEQAWVDTIYNAQTHIEDVLATLHGLEESSDG